MFVYNYFILHWPCKAPFGEWSIKYLFIYFYFFFSSSIILTKAAYLQNIYHCKQQGNSFLGFYLTKVILFLLHEFKQTST